jgi:mannan endo-1,4-beta-mannosidase
MKLCHLVKMVRRGPILLFWAIFVVPMGVAAEGPLLDVRDGGTKGRDTKVDTAAELSPSTLPLVNPNASPEARILYRYLQRISGHKILSGQHNTPGHKPVSAMSEQVRQITGKDPAVWGSDFGFTASGNDGIDNRPVLIAEALRQQRQGSIITMTWHSVCPLDNEPNEWKKSVWHKMTPEQWNELITPGTPLNRHWQAQIDVIAAFLKQLRDAHVPVLWRPFHEMSGNWFWWGEKRGERGIQALWRLEFDHFVHQLHLDNLIWVWSSASPDARGLLDFYPGPDYVDVLALDLYIGFRPDYYDQLLKLAPGKPIAMGEVGKLPTPAVLEAQPRWVWFLEWNTMLTGSNKPEQIQALYNSPRTLSRDGVKLD